MEASVGQSLKQNEMFRPASTGLDYALVVACGLTQTLEAGRNVEFRFKLRSKVS